MWYILATLDIGSRDIPSWTRILRNTPGVRLYSGSGFPDYALLTIGNGSGVLWSLLKFFDTSWPGDINALTDFLLSRPSQRRPFCADVVIRNMEDEDRESLEDQFGE